MTTTIEWRVTCRGLGPRYYDGRWGRLDARHYAQARSHLEPVIWWRENYGRGTGPWINLDDRDPNTITEVTA